MVYWRAGCSKRMEHLWSKKIWKVHSRLATMTSKLVMSGVICTEWERFVKVDAVERMYYLVCSTTWEDGVMLRNCTAIVVGTALHRMSFFISACACLSHLEQIQWEALLWAFSSASFLEMVWGLHTGAAYSRWGLTSAETAILLADHLRLYTYIDEWRTLRMRVALWEAYETLSFQVRRFLMKLLNI